MIKILFVCHGNICRSPMAEFVLRDMVAKRGWMDQFEIASAATSNEEIGNPVHHGTKEKLIQYGVSTGGKYAIKLRMEDYTKYDYLIGMDQYNRKNIERIVGRDTAQKVFLLLDFTIHPRDIKDPWYTGNFDETYDDVVEGCKGFLMYLEERGILSNS